MPRDNFEYGLIVGLVHENPVAQGDNTCMSTGGHYDPFRANGTEGLVNKTDGAPSPLYNPSPANLSTFQVGDLAGKWGALTADNGTVPARTIMEHYVRLSGDYNVVGRSVVIHDAPTDTRIACECLS
jgi:Cu/Zn superoxide dismutase